MPSPLVISGTPGRELGSSNTGYGLDAQNGSILPWVWMGDTRNRDEAPAPRPPDIRRMLDQDGKALQVSEALTLPLRAAKYKVTGGNRAQAAWTLDWIGRLDPPFEMVLGQLAGASLYHRALFEIVWGVGPDGRVCPTRIAWRPTDNTSVILDKTGQPSSLMQRVNGDEVPIPPDRSLIYLHNAHRAPGVGVADILPVWCSHWEKKAIRALWRIYLNRAAMPWLTATAANANDPGQIKSLAQRVATVRSGGVLGLGAGEGVDTLDAGGQASGTFGAALDWCDRQMTQSVMAQFLDLGQSKVGSFALSKSHADLFVTGREAILRAIGAAFTRQVVERAVRANWPAGGCPTFEFEPLAAGDDQQVVALLSAVASSQSGVNPAVPAVFVEQLVRRGASVLGLDVEAVTAGIVDGQGPDARMAAAAHAATRVLAMALPQPAA